MLATIYSCYSADLISILPSISTLEPTASTLPPPSTPSNSAHTNRGIQHMAIIKSFNGAKIYIPGAYGDPKAGWFRNTHRKPLLILLYRLSIKSAGHYSIIIEDLI